MFFENFLKYSKNRGFDQLKIRILIITYNADALVKFLGWSHKTRAAGPVHTQMELDNAETLSSLLNSLDQEFPIDLWYEVPSRFEGLPRGMEQITRLCAGFSSQTNVPVKTFIQFFLTENWPEGIERHAFTAQYNHVLRTYLQECANLKGYFARRDPAYYSSFEFAAEKRSSQGGELTIQLSYPPVEAFFAACAEDICDHMATLAFKEGREEAFWFQWYKVHFSKLKNEARDRKLVTDLKVRSNDQKRSHIITRGLLHGVYLERFLNEANLEHNIVPANIDSETLDPWTRLEMKGLPKYDSVEGMSLAISCVLFTELAVRMGKEDLSEEMIFRKASAINKILSQMSPEELSNWKQSIGIRAWSRFGDRRITTLDFLASTSVDKELVSDLRSIIYG